jgi:uncharacterized protein YggU (UPF0235/DUF167 family)
MRSPVRRIESGVKVAIRLTPKAKANRISGIAAQTDGDPILKASVTAVPERGKANAALISLLAKAWRLPKSAFTLAAGATDRRKIIHIAGDPGTLKQTLDNWVTDHYG